MTSTYENRQVWAPKRSIPWPSDLDFDAADFDFDYEAPRRSAFRLPPARRAYVPSPLPTPILALDVDGPCSPWRMSSRALKKQGFASTEWRSKVSYRSGSTWVPLPHLHLSRKLGDMLAEFSREHDVELVWGSMWEHNCNHIVAPAMGLPRLRYVDFHGHPVNHLWKWPAMAKFALDRPLAWLDDGFASPVKQRQCEQAGFRDFRRNQPTLLHYVDPALGLRRSDLDAVASWLNTAKLAWAVS